MMTAKDMLSKRPMVGFYFFANRFCYKVIFSTGSVSTNGTSINSHAGRFADVKKFRETVLWNRCGPAESHHWKRMVLKFTVALFFLFKILNK